MQQELHDDQNAAKGSDGPDPIDLHVGARLKLRRNILGMTQEHMAKVLGVTFQQIQKYERASSRIAASRLHEIAKLLNVSVSWFFEELPNAALRHGFSDSQQSELEGVPTPDADIMQKRETIDLVRAYNNITDPKQRRKVLDLMKSMADGVEK